MPAPRNDLTMDVDDTESVVLDRVIQEQGGQDRPLVAPPSPVQGDMVTRSRPTKRRAATQLTRESRVPSQPSGSPRQETARGSTGRSDTAKEAVAGKGAVPQNESVTKRNSEIFPAEERPEMFKSDEKFDLLSRDRAAKICYQHSVQETKRKEKKAKLSSLEKTDDKIPTVKIPAGDDNARDVLNTKARQLLRPPVLEMEKMMEWYVSNRVEVTRNLPLGIYGLQDCVSTKSVELCHNLASTLQIKMFSPTNLRTSATSQRQKAFADREGKLIVEQDDVYGELGNTLDVLMAWNNLNCIWQKLFPDRT